MSIGSTFNINQPCILCGDNCHNPLCLCTACQNELPYIDHACKSCGLPIETTEHANNCGACLTSPPPISQCISLLHYESPVDYLIKHMKYHNQLSIADLLGKLLAKKIKNLDLPRPQQIIPIPLHIDRLQQRGYNQAIEIGRQLSRELNIPLNLTDCSRTRSTAPQFDIPASERGDNIKNAFEISGNINAEHVTLIDDVMTTGSTVREVAKALLNAGVKQVDVWTCARATTA